MPSVTVFFAVIVASTISIQNVQSEPVPGLNVQTILQSLQQQLQNEQYKKKTLNTLINLPDDDDDDDDDDNIHYGSLKSNEVEELIRLAKNDIKFKKHDRKQIRDDDYDELRNDVDSRLLAQVQNFQNKHVKSNLKPQNRAYSRVIQQYLTPNNLLESLINEQKVKLVDSLNNDDREEEPNELGNYSKVYLILNPDVVEKSNNKRKLSELLSSLLSSSLQGNEGETRLKKKERRYKGFLVKDNLLGRRYNHESREMYSGKNSIEREYKPKRARGDRGGSGGVNLRTAIPYIRHHGDIYERDN